MPVKPHNPVAFKQLRLDLADRHYSFARLARLCTQSVHESGDTAVTFTHIMVRNAAATYWGRDKIPEHPNVRLIMRMIRAVMEKPPVRLVGV